MTSDIEQGHTFPNAVTTSASNPFQTYGNGFIVHGPTKVVWYCCCCDDGPWGTQIISYATASSSTQRS